MRFLVDECTGPKVAEWLRSEGHDVLSVYDEACGIDDGEIVRRAFAEDRIRSPMTRILENTFFETRNPLRALCCSDSPTSTPK